MKTMSAWQDDLRLHHRGDEPLGLVPGVEQAQMMVHGVVMIESGL